MRPHTPRGNSLSAWVPSAPVREGRFSVTRGCEWPRRRDKERLRRLRSGRPWVVGGGARGTCPHSTRSSLWEQKGGEWHSGHTRSGEGRATCSRRAVPRSHWAGPARGLVSASICTVNFRWVSPRVTNQKATRLPCFPQESLFLGVCNSGAKVVLP